MFKFLVTLALLVANHEYVSGTCDEDLVSVIVLYRHGDRAPIRPYKNDPYDETYWPLGFGQLTNIGKKQQYGLGQWLRKRYSDFLPITYNKKDIKILSSNIDRCLMSAELNVAGLYPPQGDQIWNNNLGWQPIPIHTVPEQEDAILAQEKPCPKYTRLYDQLMEEEPFKSTFEKYKDKIAEFSANSGENIHTLADLQELYNVLYIERLHQLDLPEWADEVLDSEMEDLCTGAWTSFAYTQDLARLKSGPLIDLIITHFEDVKNNVEDTPRLLMLSAHDSTIAPLLTALQVFDNKWPDYASSVLFEFRQGRNSEFVNVFYRNPTDVANLTLPGCDFDCDFETFQMILDPIRISVEDWDRECLEI